MYTVNWNAVDAQLLNYWTASPSHVRRAITDSLNRLEKRLRQRPSDGAQTADPDYLTMLDDPVRVFYAIDDHNQKVIVVGLSILSMNP